MTNGHPTPNKFCAIIAETNNPDVCLDALAGLIDWIECGGIAPRNALLAAALKSMKDQLCLHFDMEDQWFKDLP